MKHPTSERTACYFHAFCALVGGVHIVIGAVVIWYHVEATRRHWRHI